MTSSDAIDVGLPNQSSNPTNIVNDNSTGKDRDGDRSSRTSDSGIVPRIKGPTDVPDQALLHGAPFVVLIASVTMAVFLVSLSTTILGTATPTITSEFHTVDDVGWYAAAYLVSNCGMAPLTGTLYRMFHLKFVFIAFIGVFELGSLIAATAHSSNVLIVGRAISGIGGGGIITGSTTIIAASVPLSRRAFVIGVGMGCLALGQTIGPLIGGLLATYVSWRWCFYINLPLGGAVAIPFVLFIKLPVTRLTTSNLTVVQKILKIDLIGFLGFASACVMCLLGLEWGGETYPWNSATVIGLLCGGFIGFICVCGWFVYRRDSALIPPRLLKNRINCAIALTAFTQAGGTYTAQYWLPIWFQGVKGASPISSGIMILPTIISQLIASVSCGILVQKTGYYLPEVVGGNALVAVGAALMSTMKPDTSEGQWIGYQILTGAGRGFVLQLLVTAIQTNLPAEDSSLGSSLVMFAQYFGGAIFASVANTVFTSSIGPALLQYAPSIDPNLLTNSGVTDLGEVVPAAELPGALLAYNESIDHVFDVQLAASCAALLTGCFVGWRKVNKRKKNTKNDVEVNDAMPDGAQTAAQKTDEEKAGQ
ncbi:major facilitator superfamily domain-containing protein [Lipomyces kononenkoae]|uniref:Major facilitator superfamily domain-containing protein n=1 Tax=Lipomyces kononenkoae TaxID=34357 RepID=A0ACC3SX49_LIPKO